MEIMASHPVKVLVLCGGPGEEREVSLAGGQAVAAALRQAGHKVAVSDIGPDDLSILNDAFDFDLIFPVLHGFFGEDGQLQSILEQKKLRYVGSNPETSALAMDKWQTKKVFHKAQLPTPVAVLITEQNKIDTDKLLSNIPLPCVVKPNQQGSSVGIKMVADLPATRQAVPDCLKNYGDTLIEQYIAGREFTVGVIADNVLPVIEIRPVDGFYDYQAKYIAENTQYIFHKDTGLPESTLKEMQYLAWQAFTSLGCRDLGRVDILMDNQGGMFILEVNTIPGFTSHSLLPKAAEHINMDMKQICNMIVQTACNRPII